MSVTVTLDSKVLSRRIAGLAVLRHLSIFDASDYFHDYIDGWIKTKYTGGGYPRVDSIYRPVGELADTQMLILRALYYIPASTNAYLLFLERSPGDASTYYLGFYLGGSTLYARSYPGTLSGTTSTSLSLPAMIGLVLKVCNVGGTIYTMYWSFTYNWDADTYTEGINAVSNVGSATALPQVWYNSILEFNASSGVIGHVGPAEHHSRMTSAPTTPSDPRDVEAVYWLRLLRKHGLRDPGTIDWS